MSDMTSFLIILGAYQLLCLFLVFERNAGGRSSKLTLAGAAIDLLVGVYLGCSALPNATTQQLILVVPLVLTALLLTGYLGYHLVSDAREYSQGHDPLVRRFLEAHEQGDIARADQLSAEARQRRARNPRKD